MSFPILDALNVILLPLVIVVLLLIVGFLFATSGRSKPRPPAPRQAERAPAEPDTARASQPAAAPPAPVVPRPATARAPGASAPPVPLPSPAAALASPPAPATPGPVPAAPTAAEPAPVLAADLLLVDDSAVVRTMLRRLFTNAGYSVHLAKDGVEALGLLQQGRYAMLITDLEMPNMDGIELITAVERDPALRGLPVLAITGHDNLQDRLGACEGLTGIHRKPWNDDDLRDHVDMVVRGHRVELPFDAPADMPVDLPR